jgi:hypothetical protein
MKTAKQLFIKKAKACIVDHKDNDNIDRSPLRGRVFQYPPRVVYSSLEDLQSIYKYINIKNFSSGYVEFEDVQVHPQVLLFPRGVAENGSDKIKIPYDKELST